MPLRVPWPAHAPDCAHSHLKRRVPQVMSSSLLGWCANPACGGGHHYEVDCIPPCTRCDCEITGEHDILTGGCIGHPEGSSSSWRDLQPNMNANANAKRSRTDAPHISTSMEFFGLTETSLARCPARLRVSDARPRGPPCPRVARGALASLPPYVNAAL